MTISPSVKNAGSSPEFAIAGSVRRTDADTGKRQTSKPGEARWRVLLWSLAALAALLQVAQFAFLPSFLADYAVRPVGLEPLAKSDMRRYRVVSIDEAAAGALPDLRVGDILARPVRPSRDARFGEVARFTLIRDGAPRTIDIPYVREPVPRDVLVDYIAWPFVQCLHLALAVILLRNRSAGPPALALAVPLVLVAMPLSLSHVLPVPVNAVAGVWTLDLVSSLVSLGVPLFTLFAYSFARPQLSNTERRYARPLAWLPPAGAAALWIAYQFGRELPFSEPLEALSWVLAWCFVVGILVTGLRRTSGDLRERYASVTLSAGYLLATYVGWAVYVALGGARTGTALVVDDLLICVGVVALTVSLLRHHVVELRVVVSRTVVFSIVSALLLLAFGIAEFVSEKLLHFEGRESNVLVDAGIALILFVTARRLHDSVERFVERTLFRPWHLAVQGLRDFARDAAYVTNADVLRGRLLAALTRFADTASEARLFHRAEGGRFVHWRMDDAAPAVIDENESWLVTLRATRAPLQRSAGQPGMPGQLAVPLVRTGQVTGFVLLGPKRNAQTYRSDELAALDEVVTQVALELECLRAIEAEAQLRELRERMSVAAEGEHGALR